MRLAVLASSFPAQQQQEIGVYLASLGSLVLFLACAVPAALIAYLVLDDIRQRLFRRAQTRQPEPVIVPAPVQPARSGWFAWSNS